MADTREERALLREGAAVAHDREGVHLEAVVVVMEPKGLVADDPRVETEPARLEAVAAARVAAVEDRHVISLGHGVDGAEEGEEVPLGVDVLLPVRAQEDVPALLKAEPPVYVARLYLREVPAEDLRHRGARHVGALPRQPALGQVPPRVLAVRHVHVGDDVDYPPVRLLRQALVLAPVPRLHVEDRDVEALRTYHAQAAVRVPQHQHRVRAGLCHQLVAAADDVAHCRAEVVSHGVHVHVRGVEPQVPEEHPVEVVVVVLPGMCEQHIEVSPAFADDGGKADDLRPRAHDDQELYPPVVLEPYV